MLRPGEVKPRGWLRDWCETARDGYYSRMDEVDIAFRRAWNEDFHPRGKYLHWGDKDQGAWCAEGGAYWFEGLVRLAWQLDDPGLKDMASRRLEPILKGMHPNAIGFVYWLDRTDPAQLREVEADGQGWIMGASGCTARALAAYFDATGDERAIRALRFAFDDPRIYEMGDILSIPAAAIEAWRRCGDPKLAAAINAFFSSEHQRKNWPALRYGRPVPHAALRMRARNDATDKNADWDWKLQHGVVAFESLVSFAKAALYTGDQSYLANVRAWLDMMERRTRQPHGVTVSDEQFGWAGPSRGTETCDVAGDLLVHATMASITGEGRWADHVERSFFNAAPNCVSRDFMHHVYFQSPNRPDGNVQFPAGPKASGGAYKTKHWPLCCTAALTRLIPGFVQWMWMKPASGGLAAVLYAPNILETMVDDVAVRIDTKTDYPFNDTLEMRIDPARPLHFPLRLRIPEWCVNPRIAVNGEATAPAVGDYGFVTIDREWTSGDCVSVRFPMAPRVETMRDFNDGGKPYASVLCGPLLFAKGIPEADENTPASGAQTDGWRLDSSRALDGARLVRDPMPEKWNWPLASPVRLTVRDADGAPLELVPYGCAKLRVAMFPDNAGLK
jgi:hypothetical protein